MRVAGVLSRLSVSFGVVLLSFPALAQTEVNIPDPNLEAVIRVAIDKPSGRILDTDLLELTSLNACCSDIDDLTGLEYATNLEEIDLYENYISDLGPLAGLMNLTQLILDLNTLSDISPLSGLVNLTELDLEENRVSDLTPLAELVNLVDLDLFINNVTDISALANLTNLRLLNLAANEISDISALVANPGIGEGDHINLAFNPLNQQAVNNDIPILVSRGATVDYGEAEGEMEGGGEDQEDGEGGEHEGESESDEGGEGEQDSEGESDEGGEGEGEAEVESDEGGEGEGEEEGGDDGVCPASSLIGGTAFEVRLDGIRHLRDSALLGRAVGARLVRFYYQGR